MAGNPALIRQHVQIKAPASAGALPEIAFAARHPIRFTCFNQNESPLAISGLDADLLRRIYQWPNHSGKSIDELPAYPIVRRVSLARCGGTLLTFGGSLISRNHFFSSLLPRGVPTSMLGGASKFTFGLLADAAVKLVRPHCRVPVPLPLLPASSSSIPRRTLIREILDISSPAFVELRIEQHRRDDITSRLVSIALDELRAQLPGLPESTPALFRSLAAGLPVYHCEVLVSHPYLASFFDSEVKPGAFELLQSSTFETEVLSAPISVEDRCVLCRFQYLYTLDELTALLRVFRSTTPNEGES